MTLGTAGVRVSTTCENHLIGETGTAYLWTSHDAIPRWMIDRPLFVHRVIHSCESDNFDTLSEI
jgi:hypothetical protein